MFRYEIINSLIQKRGYKSYLEIGVRNPSDCFHHINCEIKHSVDPGLETNGGPNLATYPFTSDDFFRVLGQGILDLPKDFQWDIVFIDGLHVSNQVYKDFLNVTLHLNQSGAIVFHDASPPSIHHAREDYYDFSTSAGENWNGGVWKAIQKIRSNPVGLDKKEYSLITVDSDWGVSVCWRQTPLTKISEDFNSFFEFNKFAENRKEILNLKSVEEFLGWLENF
jgi:hypothetical protein